MDGRKDVIGFMLDYIMGTMVSGVMFIVVSFWTPAIVMLGVIALIVGVVGFAYWLRREIRAERFSWREGFKEER